MLPQESLIVQPGLGDGCISQSQRLTFLSIVLGNVPYDRSKKWAVSIKSVAHAGLLCVMASFAAVNSWAQSAGAAIHPVLRLEKPKYLLGESIRFWVGVDVEPRGVIPRALRAACSLEITRPDGSTEVQSIGWPVDGNPDWGWSGGWGFTAQDAGPYSLVLECGGQRTERLPLTIEKNEISNQVSASFQFEKSGAIQVGTPIPVVFRVKNDSPFPIKFPQRGVMMEGVYVRVARDKPAYRSDLFYPWQKLSQFPLSPDTYAWDVAAKLPSVTLEPGKRFEQRLALEDAYQFEQAGNYEVTFSTVVSILVGDKDGPFADFCPIRILGEKMEVFSVSEEKR